MPDSSARLRRLPQLLLFAACIAWYFGAVALAASAANGLAFRLPLGAGRSLLEACFRLFLLVIGFRALQLMARRATTLRELVALPERPTAGREWLGGAALGWGMVVAALLPLVLFAKMHAKVDAGGGGVKIALLTLAALAVMTLAHEMTFRGFPFRCLVDAVGSTLAVSLMVLAAGVAAWRNPWVPGGGVLAGMLLTLLLCLAWLRTHAVWLAWGLHFSLAACAGVLFGVPLGGSMEYASIVRSDVSGPDWLTGGDFGPIAGGFSLVVLVGAIVALYRVTREYAWSYTHAPIVPGGYEVSVAPPAAHSAMESKAAATPALVQILATTSTSFSAGTGVPPPPMPEKAYGE